jgi:hypothetical protein
MRRWFPSPYDLPAIRFLHPVPKSPLVEHSIGAFKE